MGDVNISELLGDQPLIDDGDDGDGGQEGTLDQGGDYDGQEAPESVTEGEPQAPRVPTKVPLAALQEERARRQELQDQLKSQQESSARMEERFGQMMQLMQQGQPQPQQEQAPQAPAFIDDPEGHINALKAQFEAELGQLRQYQQQSIQQQQYSQQGQQLAHQVASAEETFRKTNPDYNEAANFFMQRKTLEYTALGADPIAVQQAIQRDYQSLAVGAAQAGRNAAEMLYALSKAMGYTPQKAGQQPAGQPKQAPSSLSNMGGAPRAPDETGSMTLEAVGNMSDADFDKFWKQMERGSKQRPTF